MRLLPIIPVDIIDTVNIKHIEMVALIHSTPNNYPPSYTKGRRINQNLQQGNLSIFSITKPDNSNSLADKHNQQVPLYKNNQQSQIYNMKNTYQPAIYTANPRRCSATQPSNGSSKEEIVTRQVLNLPKTIQRIFQNLKSL